MRARPAPVPRPGSERNRCADNAVALMRRLDALMAKQLSAQKERGHVPSV